MKPTLVFLTLLSFITAARADYVIRQKAEADASGNGAGGCQVIMKIKGDKMRVDTFCNPSGNASKIMDLDTGDSTTLTAQGKQAIKQKTDMNAPASAALPKLTDLGKTETVAGYKTEIYTWTNDNSGGTVWVARNFPDYAKIRPQFEKMSKMSAGDEPDVYALGMAVKIKEYSEGALGMTLTLVSAKEEPVDASVFEIPKDYQVISPPGN